MNLKQTVSVVGVGETGMSKQSGKTTLQLWAEAALAAVHDAGLTMNDIDGVIVAPSLADGFIMPSVTFCDYMNLFPKFTTAPSLGGAVGGAMVNLAMMAIHSGACNTVLIIGGESRSSTIGRNNAVALLSNVSHPDYEAPFGTLVPGLYSLIAQRHMALYHTTPEQLAEVSAAMRYHASMNPYAFMRTPIEAEDVLRSKMIADPLHLLECSSVCDGAGAIVVTGYERARSLRKKPVQVIGCGEGYTHEYLTTSPDIVRSGAEMSGMRAFSMAGIAPGDIDVALLYDCFSITVVVELEDLGFCEKGAGGWFVENKGIRLGQTLPVNTHGGLLSHGHSGGGASIFHIIEAVRQLRNEAGERQVEDARYACVHSNGGVMSAHVTLILTNES